VARRLTLTELVMGFLVLVVSVAAVSCALYSLFDARDQSALVFAAGGIYLAVWAAVRLCAPSRA
jgi:uncharacterized membrane protein